MRDTPSISPSVRYADPPGAVTGELRQWSGDYGDTAALQLQLRRDGYLYLPGFLSRELVLEARADLVLRLTELGIVRTEGERLLPGERCEIRIFDDVAKASAPLHRMLYDTHGPLIALFERIFGEAVRHYDFTWLRAYPHGQGTAPHMDSVFMNRGTKQLMSVWTPIGDINRMLGGVTVLSASHLITSLTDDYGSRDVDTYCTNDVVADHTPDWTGALSAHSLALAERQGLQWLSADYLAGDVLTFPMFTTHSGLANRTDEVRLSCDSRFQPASHDADERWVGPNPGAHAARSKRGRIC